MKNGFTLIELLVVLVIISLVSAFVAPRVTAPIANLQLKTASKKIAAAMRYSRSRAVSEKESRVCFFDFDHQRMRIFSESSFDSMDPEEVYAGGSPEIQYDLPPGVLMEKAHSGDISRDSGLFPVIFFTNGSASGGTIFLSSEKGKSIAIQVDFITGMVDLKTGETMG